MLFLRCFAFLLAALVVTATPASAESYTSSRSLTDDSYARQRGGVGLTPPPSFPQEQRFRDFGETGGVGDNAVRGASRGVGIGGGSVDAQRPNADYQDNRRQRMDERRAQRDARRDQRLNLEGQNGLPGNVQVLRNNNAATVDISPTGAVTQQAAPVDPQQAAQQEQMNRMVLQGQQAQTQELQRLRRSVDQLPRVMNNDNLYGVQKHAY